MSEPRGGAAGRGDDGAAAPPARGDDGAAAPAARGAVAADRRAAPVLVVGDLLVDVVAAVDGPLAAASDTAATVTWSGGGAGANVAAALAAAGVDVTLVARVGDDVAGRSAREDLEAAGVRCALAVDPGRLTGTCVIVVAPGGERTMLPDRGAAAALAPSDLPGDAAATHLHLSGYVLLHEGSRAAGLAALARARAAGMTISVDPASAAPLAAHPAFLEDLGRVDVLLPNADEARVLTGEGPPAAAARALAAHAGEVVVTLGDEGALWTDGAEVVRARAPAVTVRDSTGAGDAFTAAWLAARLRGAAPAEALTAACAAGAAVAGRAGAR